MLSFASRGRKLSKQVQGHPSFPCRRGGSGVSSPVRTRLLASGSVVVENSALPAHRPLGRGYSPATQIVLPYHGAFSWKVGATDRLVDANAVLFVTGGEEFFEAHPIAGVGHASAILTPSEDMLERLRPAGRLLRRVTVPARDRARLTVHALLFDAGLEPLAREEIAVALLEEVLESGAPPVAPSRSVVQRAKELLHAHAHQVLSLDFVSHAVGVTPIYLTQIFSRSEGMPMYRYQMRLRLSRALLDLQTCRSITELALELGFSSHSHFTTTFRNAFGITPSAFRAQLGVHST